MEVSLSSGIEQTFASIEHQPQPLPEWWACGMIRARIHRGKGVEVTIRGSHKILDDPTPLNGTNIGVGARIGWVLRMSRHLADGSPRLEDLARTLGTNTTRLHRLETGMLRDGHLVDGYERALGLPSGSLRAPIDVMCRSFPESPADRRPERGPDTVEDLSRLTELVLDPGRPVSGGEWLAWASAMAAPGNIGLPESLAAAAIRRLIRELNSSVGAAYPARYEALALLRSSGYGRLVVEVCQDAVDQPHVQVLNDMMSAAAEWVSDDVVDWCIDLLLDERDQVVHAASLALENLAQISDANQFWPSVADRLVPMYNEAPTQSMTWRRLSHLLRLVPPGILTKRPRSLRQRPDASPSIPEWSRTRRNTHWQHCLEAAAQICQRLAQRDDPLLARLLFDIAVSPYESRAVTGYMLVGAIPDLGEMVGRALIQMTEAAEDNVLRTRLLRRLAGTRLGYAYAEAEMWATSTDPDLRGPALELMGAAGTPVPTDMVRDNLRGGGPAARSALYALGMTADPSLERIASSSRFSPEVRGGAQWWLTNGPRALT
jgi:hypothetical protein